MSDFEVKDIVKTLNGQQLICGVNVGWKVEVVLTDHGTYCAFATLGSDVQPTKEVDHARLAQDDGCSLLGKMIAEAEVQAYV